jgi:hypothetical protein
MGTDNPLGSEDPKVIIEKLLRDDIALSKAAAASTSITRLLAENSPVGDLILYALLDDGRVTNDLWARLKILAGWLEKTEELYAAQFPEGFPQKDGYYDLTLKPEPFKTRFEIFKELAEAWESCAGVWTTEIVLNDPVIVIKRLTK